MAVDRAKISATLLGLQKEDPTVVRFYLKRSSAATGDEYWLFGTHAEEYAKEAHGNINKLKPFGSKKNAKKGLKVSTDTKLTEICSSILLTKALCCEIYEWESNKRKLVMMKSGTPGNLKDFDEILGYTEEPWAMTIWAEKRRTDAKYQIGIAVVSTALKTIKFAQFLDESTTFKTLENAMNATRPSEVVTYKDPKQKEANKKIAVICQKSNVARTTPVDKKWFREDRIQTKTNIKQLVGQSRMNQVLKTLDESPLAMQCIGCAMNKFGLLEHVEFGEKYKIEQLKNNFMRLDAGAMSALLCFEKNKINLAPKKPAERQKSLFGLLDHCSTQMGRRMLADWLKQPSIDMKEIQQRLDMVQILVDNPEIREDLKKLHLSCMVDAEKIFQRVKEKYNKDEAAEFKDLYNLAMFAGQLPGILEALKEYNGRHQSSLEPLRKQISKAWKRLCGTGEGKGYWNLIDFVFDQAYWHATRKFRINAERDAEMLKAFNLREDMMKQLKELAEDYTSIIQSSKGKKTKNKKVSVAERGTGKRAKLLLKFNGKSGELKLKTKIFIENEVDKSCNFTTAPFRQLAERYNAANSAYWGHHDRIMKEITRLSIGYAGAFELAPPAIARLDLFVSLAHVAATATEDYVRPRIVDGTGSERSLILKGARHPLLEMIEDNFIKNDVEMKTGASNYQIITGPNMGGKSTYITMIGIIALMAQLGSFVPCDQAQIPIFDSILCRVGAGDQQLKGISTFMAEMMETTAIVNESSPKSLVIIDELGRGTSTSEGLGIAKAISEHMSQKETFCLFATHFHELTALEADTTGVQNKHVDVHVEGNKLKMCYRVKNGACNKSFGIHVARMAKFPQSVIDVAQTQVEELESRGTIGSDKGKIMKFWNNFMAIGKMPTSTEEEASAQDNALNALHQQFDKDPMLKALINVAG